MQCLHASEHVAYCCIQRGFHRQAGFHPLPAGLHLGDERGCACHAATPHLPRCVRQGGRGENWRTTGSSLVLGFQAPYCVEPATWQGACSSDHLPSPPGGSSPHPCWSMSQRSFLKACSRGPRLRYLSGPLPVCTGT